MSSVSSRRSNKGSLSVKKKKSLKKIKETPKPFSLLKPSTWLWWLNHLKPAPDPHPVYEPEPVYAYVLITLHGAYSFKKNDPSKLPRELSDLPSEPYLEPLDELTLKETGIKTLKWIRAVPGGVCNYTTHDEIDNFYNEVKGMADANKSDIIFKRTSITVTDSDFLNTQQKHYEEKNFMDMDSILNKNFDVTEGEMNASGSNPYDFRIWLMNTETDITKQVLTKKDDNYHGNLKDVLNWLKIHGYDHVVLVDLSCASAFVGPDMLTGVDERRSFAKKAAEEINRRRGGKKKNTQTRRKKLKRGKTRKHVAI
jgi:hypothetical protein